LPATARLARTSGSATFSNSSRTEPSDDTAAKLFCGSLPWQRQVLAHHRVEQRVRLGVEVATLAEDVAERLGLVEYPSVHGRDQGVAADEVHLQRQDAEQQVTVGRGAGRWMRHGCSPPKIEAGASQWD
jgi:hypothetical protein